MTGTPAQQHASVEPPEPRRRRERITRTERLTLGTLEVGARDRLVEELYAIYRESSSTLDRTRFQALFFSNPTTRVALFRSRDGTLAGFSNATLLRVKCEGREHAVFSAGVYFRLGYRGGRAAAVFGLTESLRFKLRHPLMPLAYLSMASTPAPYCLFARMGRRFYPRRDLPTPPGIEALVREVSRVRGLTPISEDDPWRVKSFVRPTDAERLASSERLRDNPDALFYRFRNPGYATGEGTALLVWVPLDLANVSGALVRAAWQALAE